VPQVLLFKEVKIDIEGVKFIFTCLGFSVGNLI